MESFSSLVKKHLCEKSAEEFGVSEGNRIKRKNCCAAAFCRGALLFLPGDGDRELFRSDREDFSELIAYLMISRFSAEPRLFPKSKTKAESFELFFSVSEQDRILGETEGIAFSSCRDCAVMFLRAAFLSCGTVMDPRKGYHAAFYIKNPCSADELIEVLALFDIEGKKSTSSKGNFVYLKESGKIEDLLSLMGAQRFSLELMNRKIEKSIRGNINRRQNFDGANLQKTVNGAQHVIEAIHYLEKKEVLPTLSEPMQKAAKLRLSYPEVSLKELCSRSEDEITKSGLNHRLQKLCQLAEKLKSEEEK
ncbi:MAG: DNA-binding protein WhiA [Clostridia bacterium]|nr:DNA-binding protein WhiA [Clostridia bacterium]